MKAKIKWSEVDWSKSVSQLATELGYSEDHVSRMKRKETGLGSIKNWESCKFFVCDWSKVDWSKSNDQLQKELGCHLSTVSRNRAIYAPETIDSRYQKSYDWFNVDWSKSNKEISSILGCSYDTVAKRRRELFKVKSPRTSKVNNVPV